MRSTFSIIALLLIGTIVPDTLSLVQLRNVLQRQSSTRDYMLHNRFAQTGTGAIYFVDNNHPSSSDINPGTADSPFKTLQRGVNVLSAGDTLLVKNGYYTPTADLYKNL